MTWLQQYRLRQYLASAIWVLPVVGLVGALVAVLILSAIETGLGLESDVSRDTAVAVLGALASAMFTFVVFVSSALLIMVQLASQTLTPRIISLVLRDPFTKSTLTLFVFTFAFALGALVRIKEAVPLLTTQVAAYG